MHNRIKEVRKSAGLTQQEFADRLGIPRSNVGGYETGARAPADAAVKLICREFHINELWLRTGEGKMTAPVNRDAELAAFLGEVMRGESEDFRRRLLAVLSRLDFEEWKLLESMAVKLAAEVAETKKEDQTEA